MRQAEISNWSSSKVNFVRLTSQESKEGWEKENFILKENKF